MSNIKFDEFRKKYSKFIYEDYIVEENSKNIVFKYVFEIEGLTKFTPEIIIDKSQILKYNSNIETNNNMFKNLVFNLGLIEMISYYKITCCKNIYVKCGYLTEKQVKWLKKLIYTGLGEFMYLNNIEVSKEELVSITSNNSKKLTVSQRIEKLNGQLIPIGGGKDSCVTLEVLEPLRKDNTPFIINTRKATLDTVARSGYENEYISVTRTLDKEMLRLNKEGFLNGHTPFSAMLAFNSLIIAYLTNKKYIVLSNESSANEPSVVGTEINHQYSKSFEFENDFRKYEKEYLKTGIEYFSLLRPLTEVQIAMLFSKYDKYHDIFRSCNAGSKEDKWCCNCSKCLFVYIILSPFLSKDKLNDIFGENLLNRESLKEIFLKLIGETESKPFDCVGTYEEINFAVCKTINKYIKNGDDLPYLLEYYLNNHLNGNKEKAENISEIYEESLLYGFEANNLGEKFEKLLNKALKRRENGRIN